METALEPSPETEQVYLDLVHRAEQASTEARKLQEASQNKTVAAVQLWEAVRALVAVYPSLRPEQVAEADAGVPTQAVNGVEVVHVSDSDSATATERESAAAFGNVDRMSTKEAVLAVLGHADRWMSIANILVAITDQGLLAGKPAANDNRVKVATIRLEKDGLLERRKGPGRGFLFRVRPDVQNQLPGVTRRGAAED